MKLIQTDFKQQSLVMLPRTKNLINEIIESMLESKHGSPELRAEATTLQEFLSVSDFEDKPTVFRKYRFLSKCQDCAGSGQRKFYPADRNMDIEFRDCQTCQGSGQLYTEIIRKGYPLSDAYRQNFAK